MSDHDSDEVSEVRARSLDLDWEAREEITLIEGWRLRSPSSYPPGRSEDRRRP